MKSTRSKPHNIALLNSVPIENVFKLLSHYPFKKEIWKSQGIQADKVTQFHLEIIKKKCEGSAWKGFWGKDKSLAGLYFLEEAVWPSQMLQKKVFQTLYPLKKLETSQDDWKFILHQIPSLAKNLGADLVCSKVDAEDYESFNILTQSGWTWLGLSLFLTFPSKSIDSSGIQKYTFLDKPGLTVREYEPRDREEILEISNSSHERNHYLNDPLIDLEVKETIFPLWVDKCLNGLAAKTLVAEYEGKVAGFITLMLNKGFSKAVGINIGIIDFVAINKNLQGKGIGKVLTQCGMKWLALENDHIILRTIHDNYGAIKFYQRLGYTIVGGDHHFHLHL